MRRLLRNATILFVVQAALVVACTKKDDPTVCTRCHMTIAPTDPYRTVLVYDDGKQAAFDSVACALSAYGPAVKNVRVHEYYSGEERDATGLSFVRGSDVPSPMGDDWIPVDPANLKKFETDHGMKQDAQYDEVLATVYGRPK